MKRTKKQPRELSLFELRQEIQSRTSMDIIPADQQQYVLQVVTDMLQACAKLVERPLPGKDIQEIRGHVYVKRAMEVAAAGGHNILLIGPTGAGKALLAQTFPSLLPTAPVPYPFRMPSASISPSIFIGEPTIAHGGVMFLENLDAYDLRLLDTLQQAVETHIISIPHGETYVILPAQFVLIATVTPCPCGCSSLRDCTCSTEAITQHQQRISTIVHTCFDIKVQVQAAREDILSKHPGENSIRFEVALRQHVTYKDIGIQKAPLSWPMLILVLLRKFSCIVRSMLRAKRSSMQHFSYSAFLLYR